MRIHNALYQRGRFFATPADDARRGYYVWEQLSEEDYKIRQRVPRNGRYTDIINRLYAGDGQASFANEDAPAAQEAPKRFATIEEITAWRRKQGFE